MSASPPDSHDGRPEGPNQPNTSSAARIATRSAKKRTKTGCLTCRKRRIKCGEEKPVCNNCVKSKRLCEGYNQRVVFKHPIGGFHRPGIGSDPSHGANAISPYYEHGLFPGPPVAHLPIAPRPYQTSAPLEIPASQLSSGGTQYDASGHIIATTSQPPVSGAEAAWAPALQSHRMSHHEALQDQSGRSLSFPHIPTSAPDTGRRLSAEQPQLRNALPASWEHHSPRQDVSPEAWYLANSSRQNADSSQYFPTYRSDYLDIQAQIQALQKENPTLPADRTPQKFSRFGFSQRPSFDLTLPLPTEPAPPPGSTLQDDEEDEEDPFDVEMDVSQVPVTSSVQAEKDYGLLMAVHASQDRRRYRTFTTFLNEPNVLASYRPSHSASPLTDEKTARLFCHFVTSTGPSLSIFERQATHPSAVFSGLPIPAAQQALWTYTLPTMALNHPPLMHAILALAAIHISKLQQTSAGPSLKHFQYALRRVSKLIGLPQRRNEVSTLATSLAVTFYEIMSADHSKWSIHLAGAKVLVMEIDFAGTTRMIRAMRAQAKARISHAKEIGYGDPYAAAGVPDAFLVDKDWEVDQSLISGLTGFRVRYDQQWQSNGPSYYPREELTQKDVENHKIRSDLYWWYCKQDIFQSMISGNRLLMPYEHWVYCPPRGQISRLDTIYATMDHLCLLMARLTDFGAKDQRRKRRYISAHGGQWRPPPGLFGPPSNGPSPQGPGPPGATQSRIERNPKGDAGNNMPPAFLTPGRHRSNKTGSGAQALEAIPTDVAGGGVRSGHPPQHTNAPSAGPSESPMYGMMPTPADPIQMPSAFTTMTANLNDPGLQNHPAEEYANVSSEAYSEGYPLPGSFTSAGDSLVNHKAELEAALTEHVAITSAFDLFTSSLTAEFHCLAADAAPPIGTPFGPALQYRTHHIACIWTLYNAGRILIHRLHPHMPPAAMIAASVAARQTNPYAQNIGKICAGLYYPQRDSLRTGLLNPSLGAALMESTFPLFFGAVQFTDAAQRGWTISKLRDIARLTGWQTSAAIAAGCEITWERLGKAGKGPPYRPTMDRENRDERVSMKKKEKRSRKGKETLEEHDGAETRKEDVGRERKETRARENDKQANREVEDEEENGHPKDSDEDDAPATINHDRRFISSNPNARVHWALGILSVEEDIAKLDLGKS